MKNMSIFSVQGLRVMAVILSGTIVAGCRSTNSHQSAKAKQDAIFMSGVPILKLSAMSRDTLSGLVEWGRADAEAMFGGRALLRTIAFDSAYADGPCKDALGARLVYEDANPEALAEKAFAMIAIDPTPRASDLCANGTASTTKSKDDVSALVSGTRAIEAVGTISPADGLKKTQAKYPTFKSIIAATLITPDRDGFRDQPWLLIHGISCSQPAALYVNLLTGSVVQTGRPIVTNCKS